MIQIALRTGLIGLVCLFACCGLFRAQATQPGSGTLRKLVADIGQSGGQAISPDGKKLLWYVVTSNEAVTFVRDLDSGETGIFRIGRQFPYWMYDSRHLVMEQESGENGDTVIMLFDTARPHAYPLNLTPWNDSTSHVIHVGDARSNRLTFVSNRRDASLFDVYVVDLKSTRVELLLKNPGDVVQWLMDADGTVGARVRLQGDDRILQVMNRSTNAWKSVYKWAPTELGWPVRIDRAAGKMTVVSNVGRQKTELIEVVVMGLGPAR